MWEIHSSYSVGRKFPDCAHMPDGLWQLQCYTNMHCYLSLGLCMMLGSHLVHFPLNCRPWIKSGCNDLNPFKISNYIVLIFQIFRILFWESIDLPWQERVSTNIHRCCICGVGYPLRNSSFWMPFSSLRYWHKCICGWWSTQWDRKSVV